jgi:DNA-binding NarL/FixJ family response regulator
MDSSMKNPIRVLIVKTPHRLTTGLTTALTIHPDIEHVGTSSSAAEAITHCQQICPDVVLIELVMLENDCISTIQKIHQQQPHIQIITLSKLTEDSLVRQAREAGAVGNVQLGDSADSIATTIYKVFQNAKQKHTT